MSKGIYVIGDVHGSVGALYAMAKMIRDHRDLDSSRVDADVVFVGDYVDRGPDSKGVIDYIIDAEKAAAMAKKQFDVIPLKGNHEDMMLFKNLEGFMLNGGIQTLMSYGVDLTAVREIASIRSVVGEEHYAWLNKLPTYHVAGAVAIAHAGLIEGITADKHDPNYLLWDRTLRTTDHGIYKFTVHGHTPMNRPRITKHVAYIDTGAVFGGPLTALWIPDVDNPDVEQMETINSLGEVAKVEYQR